ncbi:MAG: NnrS family protein [Proteobacteria bacterium]|nr:NnrS family protein [Pseudomonadota bacterium]
MSTSAERYRSFEDVPLFGMGFRPFFLAAGIWAAAAAPLWMARYFGGLPQINRDWHVHEMLFGYLSSVIAGFLLTAIPNWTGRLPVTGMPLFLLFSLWCVGRIAMLAAPDSTSSAVLDSLFLLALAGIVGREVMAGRNVRNLPVFGMVGLLAVANILTHLRPIDSALATLGERSALAIVAMLLALIGGRITPSFTRNWLAKRQSTRLPSPPDRFDALTLAITGLSLISWLALPDLAPAGAALVVAGALNAARLSRWCGRLTTSEPLLLILHVGYAWLAFALALVGAHVLAPTVVASAAGVHALTAGAFGVMTLAVMTRVTRGHTGQPLTADRGTQLLYALVNASALLRVMAPFISAYYTLLLVTAAFLWSGAFVVFVARYAPLMLRPRRTG